MTAISCRLLRSTRLRASFREDFRIRYSHHQNKARTLLLAHLGKTHMQKHPKEFETGDGRKGMVIDWAIDLPCAGLNDLIHPSRALRGASKSESFIGKLSYLVLLFSPFSQFRSNHTPALRRSRQSRPRSDEISRTK